MAFGSFHAVLPSLGSLRPPIFGCVPQSQFLIFEKLKVVFASIT